jgi:transcriptional regulator with PAS, ATPase and Fis domain
MMCRSIKFKEHYMQHNKWVDEFPVAMTVCDSTGVIIEMNDESREVFANRGGGDLIGQNLMECHSPRSQEIIRRLLQTGEKNVYTIKKKGQKKLIYQCPWYEGGRVMGLVEISIPLPEDMPHFDRD